MPDSISPRRSSRARTTQPPHLPQHSSASSSISSRRAERDTRADSQIEQKPNSMTPAGPLSNLSDSPEPAEPETRQTRQRKRAQDARNGYPVKIESRKREDDDSDEDEEEEVTRCVCQGKEYPGPPVPLADNWRSHHHVKDRPSPSAIRSAEKLPEDAGGLFIQCDVCHVWQHGGCVGIMDEGMSPENYYCEECRPELHKILIGAKVQRYSRYKPVVDPVRSTSRKQSSSKEPESRSSKEANGKSGPIKALSSSAKRRSTMNSRAAMDEEEAFKRAIEESKGNRYDDEGNGGTRKGKRGRERSEERSRDLKRLKTSSESITPPNASTHLDEDSDVDQLHNKPKANTSQKKRNGHNEQAQQQMELRQREKDRETERAEAAGRRKGRAEKRRADDPEFADDPQRAQSKTRTSKNTSSSNSPTANPSNNHNNNNNGNNNSKQPKTRAANPASKTAPAPSSTSATLPQPPTTTYSHKKQPTRPGGPRKKVGRNQYSNKPRASSPQPHSSANSNHPSGQNNSNTSSAEERPATATANDKEGEGAAEQTQHKQTTHQSSGNGSKPAKPRHLSVKRNSLNELRKRAAAILEFISRTQVEMAGTATATAPERNGIGAERGKGEGSKLSNEIRRDDNDNDNDENKNTQKRADEDQGMGEEASEEPGLGFLGVDEARFRRMGSAEMMDVLTRGIVRWQGEHGKYGEK